MESLLYYVSLLIDGNVKNVERKREMNNMPQTQEEFDKFLEYLKEHEGYGPFKAHTLQIKFLRFLIFEKEDV